MDDRTKASNLVRGFNMAATIVANLDLTKSEPKDVAATVGELAAALYQEQNALFDGENLKADTPAPAKSGGGGWSGKSSSGGGGGDGPTDKQIGFASKLIADILEGGGTPEVDLSDFKGLGSVGDASAAIEKLIAAAPNYGN